MEKDLTPLDLWKEESEFIREMYFLREGLMKIEEGKFQWTEPPFQDKRKKPMNILRRLYRILGNAFRVIKTLLKQIRIKDQPKKEPISHGEAVRARDQAKYRLDYLLEVIKERERISKEWN